jgi:hypothetical protein
MALDEDAGLIPASRAPCPNCGSTSRHFSAHIFASVTAVASVSTRFILLGSEGAPDTGVIPSSDRSRALPRFGELLLYIFLTRTERINLIGDLIEDYDEARVKFGIKSAVKYFYVQVVRSLWPLLRRILFKASIIACAAKTVFWALKIIVQLING